MVKTKGVLLKMELKIDIPQDIILDKKRLKSYGEGLAFKIVKAIFEDYYSTYDLPEMKNQPSPGESGF